MYLVTGQYVCCQLTHLVITKKHVELVEVVPGFVFLFLRQIRILVFSLITKTVKIPTRRK